MNWQFTKEMANKYIGRCPIYLNWGKKKEKPIKAIEFHPGLSKRNAPKHC